MRCFFFFFFFWGGGGGRGQKVSFLLLPIVCFSRQRERKEKKNSTTRLPLSLPLKLLISPLLKLTKLDTIATSPGANMPHLHPYAAAAEPARIGAKKPPTLLEAVQKPQKVPRRASGYHDVRMRAQAGAPSPCSRPLIPQKSMNSGKDDDAPTAMFARAVAASPPPRSSVGWVRAPRTPEANLETPYITGSTEVRAPTDC